MRLGDPAFDIASGHALGRRIGGSFVIRTAALAIAMVLARMACRAPRRHEDDPIGAATGPSRRAARAGSGRGVPFGAWGMTEAQVKAAILKDFNIAADKVQTEENSSERTTVLSITVNELLEGAGKARVSYILGYSSKKLIQVNVVWGTSIDPQAKPEDALSPPPISSGRCSSARAMTRRRRPATWRPARVRSRCSRARIRKSTRRCCAW